MLRLVGGFTKRRLISTSFAMLLYGIVASARAQGIPSDDRYVSLSPSALISSEPFTLIENSPNVPDGQTLFVNLTTFDPAHPLYATTQAGLCTLTQAAGAANCQLGRVPPGTYRLYVTAFSSNNTPYINAQLDLSVSPPGTDRVSALQGQYAFQVTTPSIGNSNVLSASAAIGSFTADGKGNITAGVIDVNNADNTFTALPVTGTYQLDMTGKGSIALRSSQGIASFTLFVPVPQTTSNVASATVVSSLGGLITGSGKLTSQSGTIQSPAPVNPGFGPSLNGIYQFTGDGEFFPQTFSLAAAGQFTFNAQGGLTSAGKLLVHGVPLDYSGVGGTYTSIDATTGRATMTLSISGQPASPYAIYELSEQSFYFMSLSPHAAGFLLEGTGKLNQ